jgi:hypothetical protein
MRHIGQQKIVFGQRFVQMAVDFAIDELDASQWISQDLAFLFSLSKTLLIAFMGCRTKINTAPTAANKPCNNSIAEPGSM